MRKFTVNVPTPSDVRNYYAATKAKAAQAKARRQARREALDALAEQLLKQQGGGK